MHVVFIPYGIYSAVEHLKIELQAQKFMLKMYKKGEAPKDGDPAIWIQGRLCLGIGGIWEYSFPKEYLDLVLTTLDFHLPCPIRDYKLGMLPFKLMRGLLRVKSAPKNFPTDKKLLWIREGVTIIPIGIRDDAELTEPEGEYTGWTHEAI